jgi:hypothetical protein
MIRIRPFPSGDDVFHYAAFDVGKPEITAAVTVGKPLMIEPQQMPRADRGAVV